VAKIPITLTVEQARKMGIGVDKLGPKSPLRDLEKAKRKPQKQWKDDEHKGQALFFSEWKPLLAEKYPDVAHIMGIPLFQTGKAGFAGMNAGKRANAEGRRKGTWDILYPVSRGGFLSLWIEVKAWGNDLTPEQEQFGKDMTRLGHQTAVVFGKDPYSIAVQIANAVEKYETNKYRGSV
jgi:hypothetical protein